MRPIVIGITTDGKVDMTIGEFRKHMDDAYERGCQRSTSSLQSFYTVSGCDKWWNDEPLCTLGTTSTTKGV